MIYNLFSSWGPKKPSPPQGQQLLVLFVGVTCGECTKAHNEGDIFKETFNIILILI